jgi:hypothetical protein
VARAQAGGWGGGLRRTLDNEDEADGEGADRHHLSWRRRLSWAGVRWKSRGSAFQTAWLSVNFAKQPSHCLSCFQKMARRLLERRSTPSAVPPPLWPEPALCRSTPVIGAPAVPLRLVDEASATPLRIIDEASTPKQQTMRRPLCSWWKYWWSSPCGAGAGSPAPRHRHAVQLGGGRVQPQALHDGAQPVGPGSPRAGAPAPPRIRPLCVTPHPRLCPPHAPELRAPHHRPRCRRALPARPGAILVSD